MAVNKYRQAVAVTPNDSTDLTTAADAIYIGDGDYTSGFTKSTLAPDAGDVDVWWRAHDTYDDRGTDFLNNGADTGTSLDAEFKSEGGAAVPQVVTTDANLRNREFISFTGIDQYIFKGDVDVLDLDADFSMVLVIKFTDIASNLYEAFMAKDDTVGTWQWYKKNDNTITVSISGADPTGGVTMVNDQWYILEWSRSGSTNTIYTDGVSEGTPATNSLDMTSTDHLYIGKRNNAAPLHFTGGIAEILIWENATLSADDRTILVRYLQDKYFNTPQVDVAYDSPGSSNVTTKRLRTGTVHNLKTTRVRDTGTDGTDIVALYE
jgi:hypothetical protein